MNQKSKDKFLITKMVFQNHNNMNFRQTERSKLVFQTK